MDYKNYFKRRSFRKAVAITLLVLLTSSLCGCRLIDSGKGFISSLIPGDKDSERAFEKATEIATAIGNNDKDALVELLSENAKERINEEDLDRLMEKYHFSIKELDDIGIGTSVSNSETNRHYEQSAIFDITAEDGRVYTLVFEYILVHNDSKNIGVSAIAFATKEYFEENEYALPDEKVILVPPEGEDE